jgi:hypothetical protein
VLKNSLFLKTAKIWGIENVHPNGESRLYGFLTQSFFDQFPEVEFFNSHACFQQLLPNSPSSASQSADDRPPLRYESQPGSKWLGYERCVKELSIFRL